MEKKKDSLGRPIHMMDQHLLSDELHELDSFRKKMKKAGIKTSRQQLRELNAQFNNSSKDIEAYLLENGEKITS